jgi:hypothetical protein
LFGPVIYSLFSKRQTAASLITISAVSLAVSLFFKIFGPSVLGITLSRTMETVLGVGFPLLLLLLFEVYARASKIEVPFLLQPHKDANVYTSPEAVKQNRFGVRVIAWSTAFVGLGISVLGYIAENGRIALIVGITIMLVVAGVLIKQYSSTGRRAELHISQ